MSYRVVWKKKVQKQIDRCPIFIQEKFGELVDDLMKTGAIQKKWKNFSALGKNVYHCHLDYSWVACWRWEKGTIIVEVQYVGSRESAPY